MDVAAPPQSAVPQQQTQNVPQSQHSQHNTILRYLTIAAAIYGVSAVLVILTQNWLGFIICVAMAAALYFAVQKTRQSDYETVKMICIGGAAAAVVFVFIDIAVRDVLAAVINGAAAGLLVYTYTLIKKG
jgi:hypothetical protein